MRTQTSLLSLAITLAVALAAVGDEAAILKTHRIFSSNMVLQRGKPIAIWGWAPAGREVAVQLGQEEAEAAADGESGRWEVK